jgi:predicted acylesterase/phospholipase RssA
VVCQLCVEKRQQLFPQLFPLPPVCVCPFCKAESRCPPFEREDFVGYRVLSLDGGGVKGLIEVIIMQEIEKRFAPLKITHLFEVIVGTSAGGIIAMALLKNIPLERISQYMKDMSKNVLDVSGFMSFLRLLVGQSTCSTAALETAMKDLFGGTSDLTYHHNSLLPPYIYCTAFDSVSSQTVLMGGLKALNKVSDQNIRSRALIPHVYPAKLWEAARCTSAAPTFFDPYSLWKMNGPNTLMLDGGVDGANCPAHLAMRLALIHQRGEIGAHPRSGMIDMCLSLGTGKNPPNVSGAKENCIAVAKKFIDVALDSERIWKEKCVDSVEFQDVHDRLRINPPDLGALNAFASSSIEPLEKGAKDFLRSADGTREMDLLVHTMFAKLWHVRASENILCAVPYTFAVTLRKSRFDFTSASNDELVEIITARKGIASKRMLREELVTAAEAAYMSSPLVNPPEGKFGCEFNRQCYESASGRFSIDTSSCVPGKYELNVYWISEDHGKISLSGFPCSRQVVGEHGECHSVPFHYCYSCTNDLKFSSSSEIWQINCLREWRECQSGVLYAHTEPFGVLFAPNLFIRDFNCPT